MKLNSVLEVIAAVTLNMSSGFRSPAGQQKFADVSENYAASFFVVEEQRVMKVAYFPEPSMSRFIK